MMGDDATAGQGVGTPQRVAKLTVKDLHRKNFFASHGVTIDYALEKSWRIQLSEIGGEDFPLGKSIPNRVKYDWYINVCQNGNKKTWKDNQVLSGVARTAMNDVLRVYEVKNVPTVPGVTNSPTVRLLKKVKKKGQEVKVVVLPIDEVFDRLWDIHSETGHAGNQAVKSAVDRHLVDIPERVVASFRKTCKVCSEANPQARPKPKGAKKPIVSNQFRDRFQGDLIDMRSKPQQDVYGIEMNWILTLKDHFTRLVYLKPLPAKEAKYVAFELHHILGLIGYPVVFHSDNGREFVAAIVEDTLAILRKLDPQCTTVQGRPRKPQDQGSIERSNGTSKIILEALEREESIAKQENRLDSNVPTGWVNLLPQVMARVNGNRTRSADITPYEHVFGVGYQMPRGGASLAEFRRCTTAGDVARVVQDDNFTARMAALSEIDRATSEMTGATTAGAATTAGTTATTTAGGSTTAGDATRQTMTAARAVGTTSVTTNLTIPPAGMTKTGASSKEAVEAFVMEGAPPPPNRSEVDPQKFMLVHRALGIAHWNHHDEKSIWYTVPDATLSCSRCVRREINPHGAMPIVFPEPAFFTRMHRAYHLWMKRDFLESFAALVNHYLHTTCTDDDTRKNVLVVPCGTHVTGSAKAGAKSPGISIGSLSILKFLAYEGLHYCVLTFSMSNNVIIVQDGYFPKPSEWRSDETMTEDNDDPPTTKDNPTVEDDGPIIKDGDSSFKGAPTKGSTTEYHYDPTTNDNPAMEDGQVTEDGLMIEVKTSGRQRESSRRNPPRRDAAHATPPRKRPSVSDDESGNKQTPRTRNFVKRKRAKETHDKAAKTRQEKQARSMRQAFGESVKLKPGAFVSITIDIRDKAVQGKGHLIGCVIKQNEESHSVNVITDYGILGSTKGASSKPSKIRAISTSDYVALDEHITTSPNLHDLARQIKNNEFNPSNHSLVSVREAQRKYYESSGGSTMVIKHNCKCKKSCGSSCGCRRKGIPCSSGCSCKVNNATCCNS